jgi:hypothetical protein
MSIKGFHENNKHKAAIFDEVVLKRFLTLEMDSDYWEVRQAFAITAYFGGPAVDLVPGPEAGADHQE